MGHEQDPVLRQTPEIGIPTAEAGVGVMEPQNGGLLESIRGTRLGNVLAVAGIGIAAIGTGAVASKEGNSPINPEPAIAQETGEPVADSALEQSCVDKALARPIYMKDKFYGKPKKNKLRLIVKVPAVGAECDGVVSREVRFAQFFYRKGWTSNSTRIYKRPTNEARTFKVKTRITRYCNFNSVKTKAQKITHGYDNKYKSKTRFGAGNFVTVNSTGKEIVKDYLGPRRKMCRKKG